MSFVDTNTVTANEPWWPQYMRRLQFLDGGREGDLVDCYGMARLIYQEQLGITLDLWPQLNLDRVTMSEMSFLDAVFTAPFASIEQGFEQAFDMAVIMRALLVNGKSKRGWWHLGVVTRPGHILHIDYHAGVVEEAYAGSTQTASSASLRAKDVRLFRYWQMMPTATSVGEAA
jgi:hypothetical protein